MSSAVKYLSAFLCSILLVGCGKEGGDMKPSEQVPAPLDRVYANFEQPDTRTYVDGRKILWSADDRITLFAKSDANMEYRFEGMTGDAEGSFARVSAYDASQYAIAHNVAVYPYSASTTIDSQEVVEFTFADTQSYAEESFGLGSNVMVARSEDATFGFKNCCGYLKLQLYGDATISHITLRGNGGETIAGFATIALSEAGVPDMKIVDGSTTLTLDCDRGVTLSGDKSKPVAFWFALPPTTFSRGITVDIYDVEGRSITKSTSNVVAIERNVIQPMSSFEVAFADVEESMSAMAGIWHLTEWRGAVPSFDIYLDITANGDVTLWQRLESRAWECYYSSADFVDGLLCGIYADGAAWGASYSVTLGENAMIWVDAADPADISIYSRAALPSDLPISTTRAAALDERFL